MVRLLWRYFLEVTIPSLHGVELLLVDFYETWKHEFFLHSSRLFGSIFLVLQLDFADFRDVIEDILLLRSPLTFFTSKVQLVIFPRIMVFFCNRRPFWTPCLARWLFLIIFVTSFTMSSANLFDLGYLGLLVACMKPHSLQNWWNCFDKYCGPLSEIIGLVSHVLKDYLISSFTQLVVGLSTKYTSGHIVYYNEVIAVSKLKMT